MLFSIWANLEALDILKYPMFLWMYYLFLFSPIIKVGFEIYELVRYSKFLKSGQQTKEQAMRVARGFRGTRIYRVYYIALMMGLIVWMEIIQYLSLLPFVHGPGESEYLEFYFWFSILLFIHILPLFIGPQIIKFSIDPADRVNKIKMIVYTIIWTIVLILALNLNFIILLFALFLA